MFRSEVARGFAFDPALRRAEEFHFLSRVLKSQHHTVSDDILYSYCDESSFLREGPASRYFWSALACLKLLRVFPGSASLLAARKSIQVMLSSISGGNKLASLSNLSNPAPEEAARFEKAKTRVREFLPRIGKPESQVSDRAIPAAKN